MEFIKGRSKAWCDWSERNRHFSIGVTYGNGSFEELSSSGATHVVDDVGELAWLFNKVG
jgi:phosphoglycolate phosphatase-like HAD superfamily hydrolase